MEAAGRYLKWQMGSVGASLGDASRLSVGDALISLGRGFLLQEREKGRGGKGRERQRGDVFLFDVIQAESQSAHANELGNAIKNIYILETAIQDFMRDAGYRVTSSIFYNQRYQLLSVISASRW